MEEIDILKNSFSAGDVIIYAARARTGRFDSVLKIAFVERIQIDHFFENDSVITHVREWNGREFALETEKLVSTALKLPKNLYPKDLAGAVQNLYLAAFRKTYFNCSDQPIP